MLSLRANRWLITAPAGFGKTTLLSELARSAVSEGAAVIWLSFDERSLPDEIIRSLCESAARVGLIMAQDGLSSAFDALLEALQGSDRSVWLFLDDVDRAPPDVLSVVNALLEDCPETCRLIIGGRPRLKVFFAKAQAIGTLCVMGADDLRFQASEEKALRRRQSQNVTSHLDTFSDGWAAAVALIADFNGAAPDAIRHGDLLFNYIEQEILKDLTQAECDVLGRCSLINEISHEDVEAIMGSRDEHAAILGALGKLDGLIKAEASPQAAYRLNPALARYFRQRLTGTAGEEAGQAIARAAARLADTGRAAEAVTLARDAHDTVLLQSLLSRQTAVDLWCNSGVEEIRRVPTLAGERLRTSEPQLLMMSAIVELKEGRILEAERQLQTAADAWPAHQSREEIDLIDIGLTVYGCRPVDQRVRDQLSNLLAPGRIPQKWLTIAQSAACPLHLQQGDLEQATKLAVAALNAKKHENLPYGELYLYYHMAAIVAVQGDTKRARDLLRSGGLILRARFAADKGADAIGTVQSAELDYELGRLASARSRIHLVESRYHRMEAWFDVYAAAFETSARLLQHDLGLLAATEHLTVNAAALRRRDLSPVADHLDALQVLMRAQVGLGGQEDDLPLAPPSATRWDQVGWRARETLSLARAAVLILNADAISALNELERLIAFAKDTGLRRMELRALLMACEVYDTVGDLERADGAFETAVQIGLATGFRRSFLDYGGPGVLERLKHMSISQAPAAGVARSILKGGEPIHSGCDVRLTRREQEVLQGIEDGGSDKIIARRLGVSEHAIRFHLKNIFQKLKAHNRAEAVKAGRRLGALSLLEPVGSALTPR